ncbi:MAG: type II toxin-antitoxin system HicA family toxin, partial [Desulfurococcales archaeon]|nr:type II toxin-antitoxin system HicA family toxin [Desulfurococcales archaeon]
NSTGALWVCWRLKQRLPRLSGREVVELLVRKFGFALRRQRGSHVVLVKYTGDRKIVTVVLLYPELKPCSLLGYLN